MDTDNGIQQQPQVKPRISTALTVLLQATHPIVSAPMCGMSMGKLAGAVANAGGVGLIGIGSARVFGPDRVRAEYALAQNEITRNNKGALGFGFLENYMDESTGDASLDACLELEPDVIFLSGFNPTKTEYSTQKWIERVRQKNSNTKVIVQTFTLSGALSAAACGAEIVVLQGVDAGGHGQQDLGASIVSLVPQVRMALNENGYSNCCLLAAGGIVTGAQMAAALVLGADGVLMGSAFVVTEESLAKDSFKERIFQTKDGTSGTIVSDVWDHLSKMAKPFLDAGYVGRALADSESIHQMEGKDPMTGVSEEDIEWYAKADYKARAVWCSSSCGLLNAPVKAGILVEKTVEEAIQALRTPQHFHIEDASG